jgi:hypothetical protein
VPRREILLKIFAFESKKLYAKIFKNEHWVTKIMFPPFIIEGLPNL